MCERLVEHFIAKEIITTQDREVYLYGLKQGISFIINIITVIILAVLMDALEIAIWFSASYFLLRSYAGGFHFQHQLNCYVFSIILIVMSITVIKYITVTPFFLFVIIIIIGVFIYKLAPIEANEKPLEDIEKKYYKKKTRRLLGGEIFIFSISVHFEKMIVAKSIVTALVIIFILLVLGKKKNRLKSQLVH